MKNLADLADICPTMMTGTIVGPLSAKTAKSAKFFIQQKTAKKILPQLADLAATANFYS